MIETEGLTGADTLLRVLSHMGVDRIFASPGSEWSPVWEALAEPGVEGMPQYLSTRHEEVAVGMASGYAKSTGKLPAVMIHTTVGSLHATMGMRGAIREQVPMVVLSGESVGFGEDEGPDPAEHRRGAPGIPELDQLGVGEHRRPAPEPGEENGQQHVGEREAPPLPVPRHPVARHQPRDVERGVDVEGGPRHRDRREPPRHRPAAHEELGDAPRTPAREREADPARGRAGRRARCATSSRTSRRSSP